MSGTTLTRPAAATIEPTYFELQAYWGATKHMGGMRSTRELIELCHIGANKSVLDIGCGVGATPAYLARQVGCQVVGVDISGAMLARAQEKMKRDGVADRVELRLADAQRLPFDDGAFDAVMSESVLTFVGDKQKAVGEYVRVTKPGGYVGINEETWIKPPTLQVIEYAAQAWDIHAEILTPDGWIALMTRRNLHDVIARSYTFRASWAEYISEIRRYSFREYVTMFSRAIELSVKNPGFRRYMKGRYSSLPKGFFQYLGYGIFVGRK